jgi:chitin disaccharide deacetylase
VRADSSRAHLLVVADDFGLHSDIDRGILECVEHGRVQGVSFCPTGRSLEWKRLIELMDQGVHVGLHLTLVGEPWSTDGRVIPDWRHLTKQLVLGGQPFRTAMDAEIRRQFQLCADKGVDPRSLSHLDSHQHVHVLAGLWKLCLAQAKEYGIPRIRVPWCPTLRIIKRSVGGIALQGLARRRRQQAGRFLACLALAHAGRNTSATLSDELHDAALAGRPDLELVAHPGRITKDLQTRYAAWKFDWNSEREALLSQEFEEAVERNGYSFAGPFHSARFAPEIDV